ncbi:thioredoxin family protein [Natrarchaeobaculum aegyptiacum]|uniref:Thiol reductase thioredoxin n=1 Tax=Natrarchaeobaculum aegyptiacum TaxID=745377 RepID=A0A2Z2HYZ0_9EURY|nr:thioredoxin family protein [Natrarchaeobaculum aegyptiacum]ARS91097.1 thiol reductase thioredoxin [Natrarchaeobaculum aegyptiacum]
MNDRTVKPVELETEADLEAFLADNDVAIVEVYTSGCPKCQAMAPVLGNVARQTGLAIGTCNPADDPAFTERLDVLSVPALYLFEDGSEVARVADGFLGGDEVVSFVAEHVPEAVDA